MRDAVILYSAVFSLMALSNAVVPVLPLIAAGTSVQGAIYSAYFLGAVVLTLPAGILCDRWGEVHFIRGGLILTVLSGLLLLEVSGHPYLLILARVVEGTGAGLFIASALSWVNSQRDHLRMSGYFMALLNAGLVTGLILSGAMVYLSGMPATGILLFTVLSSVSLVASLFPGVFAPAGGRDMTVPRARGGLRAEFLRIRNVFSRYFWLWVSAFIMVGCTGVLSALYPELSDTEPHIAGLQIAMMSVSTIATVLFVSRLYLPPVRTIQVCAVFMAVAVLVTFIIPWGFLIAGAVAGVVMIAQLAYIAQIGQRQGLLIGIFNTASYGGMTLLPFIAGLIAEWVLYPEPFLAAFLLTAGLALLVAVTIGRCTCPDVAATGT